MQWPREAALGEAVQEAGLAHGGVAQHDQPELVDPDRRVHGGPGLARLCLGAFPGAPARPVPAPRPDRPHARHRSGGRAAAGAARGPGRRSRGGRSEPPRSPLRAGAGSRVPPPRSRGSAGCPGGAGRGGRCPFSTALPRSGRGSAPPLPRLLPSLPLPRPCRRRPCALGPSLPHAGRWRGRAARRGRPPTVPSCARPDGPSSAAASAEGLGLPWGYCPCPASSSPRGQQVQAWAGRRGMLG